MERIWIRFEKHTLTGYESWDEDYATIDEARERAEYVVNEDKDASSARLSTRESDLDEQFDSTGWTCFL